MISSTVPSPVRKVCDRIKDVFSTNGCNYNAICALLCLHLFGLKSLSEAVRTMGWTQSVSSLQKEVHLFNSNRFMRRLRASILRKFKDELNEEDWCFAVDDTANAKYGKLIFRKSHWGAHGSDPSMGQRIMVLGLVNKRSGYCLPLHFFIRNKKKDEDYISGHDLVVKLLKDVAFEGFPLLPIALDSWFDSAPLMAKLDEIGVKFCIHAKEKRKVKHCLSFKSPWKNWTQFFKNKIKMSIKLEKTEHQKKRPKTKYAQEGIIYINGRRRPLKAIAMYNHKNDKKHYAIYLTNSLKMSSYFLYELSRKRWLIEEMFRALKQTFSFGKLACRGQAAAEVSICLPFLLLVSMKINPHEWNQGEGVQPKTVGAIAESIKLKNLNSSINFLVYNPNYNVVKKYKSRRNLERIKKKPIDSIADNRIAA